MNTDNTPDDSSAAHTGDDSRVELSPEQLKKAVTGHEKDHENNLAVQRLLSDPLYIKQDLVRAIAHLEHQEEIDCLLDATLDLEQQELPKWLQDDIEDDE